ncbi:MAG TPA: hypothetical protein VNP72_09665 [Longimicrobium sp.]|nr:hypothetical protein [Longimicrobium sp.]
MRKNVKAGPRAAAPHAAVTVSRRGKLLDGGADPAIRTGISRRSVRQFIHHLTGSSAPETAAIKAALKTSLFRRIEKHIQRSLGRMSVDEMMKAVEAATPADTLARVLSATPDVGIADSAWTRALLRGAAAKQRMLERAGGSLASSQVAKLLGVSVQAVKQRIERRAILAVPLAGGAWGFPAVQFGTDGRVRAGVAEVVRAAQGISPWVLLSIVCDPAGDASRPILLEALDDPAIREGVLARIATYGQHLAA